MEYIIGAKIHHKKTRSTSYKTRVNHFQTQENQCLIQFENEH